MTTATVTLPFEIRLDADGKGFNHVAHPMISGSCYGSASKAKAHLRETIRTTIEEALALRENWRQLVIGTGNGEVLRVHYAGEGSWGYDTFGPGRAGHSGYWGCETFEGACATAREHAAQCFGGVSWETR